MEFSSHFGFLWYSSFVINSAFFQVAFEADQKPTKDTPRTIIKCDDINLSLMFEGTFLSNYKHFSCQSSCLLLLLEVCKNHYRKENISVGGSKQGRDTLFWIHLRETWLNVFILLYVSMSFSTFIFSSSLFGIQ